MRKSLEQLLYSMNQCSKFNSMEIYDAVEGKKVLLKIDCGMCKIEYQKSVMMEDLEIWLEGNTPVQEAFPDLSADWRELLFCSRFCPSCFESLTSYEELLSVPHNSD